MLELLSLLISTPSFSREEGATADIIEAVLQEAGVVVERYGNNVVAWSGSPSMPVLLLNSHHDTVRPGAGWTSDPHSPVHVDGKLISAPKEEFIYIAFNKPVGIVCTTDIKAEKDNIIEYII